jgi:predicted nucleic-acid-binding protein
MAHKASGSLDTNALLRLTLGDVLSHAQAVKKLLLRSTRLEVADATLLECVFVMEKVYSLPRTQIERNILSIVRHPKIYCNRTLFERVMPVYVKYTKLSIVDCTLAEYATQNGATPLYTFDKDLTKILSNMTTLIE